MVERTFDRFFFCDSVLSFNSFYVDVLGFPVTYYKHPVDFLQFTYTETRDVYYLVAIIGLFSSFHGLFLSRRKICVSVSKKMYRELPSDLKHTP